MRHRNRWIESTLVQRLKQYPAVAVIGPRQSGKTTLARGLSSEYFDLEQTSERLRFDIEWPRLVKSKALIVLDEAQTWPELFPRLRGEIDKARQRKGRFLLLGSVSPILMRQVSESLAGRLSLVELSPFILPELSINYLNKLWLYGGFPEGGILKPSRYPQWQTDYLNLLVQRDLPNWGLPAKPQLTHRLLKMLAVVHGQIWNASQIGQSLGISYHTVNDYMHFLEGTYLIRKLEPWVANLKKRLVKSPRYYWRDTGLLHSLLGVSNMRKLLHQPWVGASWEGFVIEQILGTLNAAGHSIEPYFFRTSDGHEIDLLFEHQGKLWAIEIKLTTAPSVHDLNKLNVLADMVGAQQRVLISQTTQAVRNTSQYSCSLPEFLESLF